MDDTYSVIRFYREDHPQEVIATGLTREEAQEMCSSDDGHSSTCGSEEGLRALLVRGDWFLGFRKE